MANVYVKKFIVPYPLTNVHSHAWLGLCNKVLKLKFAHLFSIFFKSKCCKLMGFFKPLF